MLGGQRICLFFRIRGPGEKVRKGTRKKCVRLLIAVSLKILLYINIIGYCQYFSISLFEMLRLKNKKAALINDLAY